VRSPDRDVTEGPHAVMDRVRQGTQNTEGHRESQPGHEK
jgi:hypothetical protein